MNPNPRIQKYCDKALERLPSRREYQLDVDCCQWRDKIDELLGRKKKKVKPKKKKKNDDPSCCKKKDEILDKSAKLAACCKAKQKRRKVKKKRKKAAKMENCRDIIDRIYACVKPSIAIRDQLQSGRHVLCILDDLETEEYCKLKELRKMCDEDPTLPPDCEPMEKRKKCEPEEVMRRRSTVKDDKKCKLITGISRKCIYKKFTRTSRKPEEPRDDCDCFRYNFSRCSLDSEVDVGDFQLTEEGIKKIEKNIKRVPYCGGEGEEYDSLTIKSSLNEITKDTISESMTKDDTLGKEISESMTKDDSLGKEMSLEKEEEEEDDE